jgi:hypothetical protein
VSGGKECCDEKEAVPASFFEDPDVAVVLSGQLGNLQSAGDRLGENGIQAQVVRGPGEDGPGCCSAKFYLVVAREDAPAALAVFDKDWRRGMSDEQIAALEASAQIVIDPDAAETTCPACLTTFATGPAECPDCGLVIG